MKIVDPVDYVSEDGFKTVVAITKNDIKYPKKIIYFGRSVGAVREDGKREMICVQIPNDGEWQLILPVDGLARALEEVM